MVERRRQGPPAPLGIASIAHSKLSELQEMRELLKEMRVRSRNLPYHQRAQLETRLAQALEELERQIEALRALHRASPG